MTSHLDLKGILSFNKNKYKTELEVFNALENIGLSFSGTADFYTEDNIKKDVNFIDNNVTAGEILSIIDAIIYKYEFKTLEEICDMVEYNFGTRSWDEIMLSGLKPKTYSIVDKYNKANWIVSDAALGDIGTVIANKIAKLPLEEIGYAFDS